MSAPAKGPSGQRRGRGARERILAAATRLFREQGINSTGMDQLCAVAEVSKRTAYQHFGSKDDLVAAYLHELNIDPVAALSDDLPAEPRERLTALFERLLAPEVEMLCPFIGAAVELADPRHPARAEAVSYKTTVTTRLVEAARDAGAHDPEALGDQLALLLDGASVRRRTLGADPATAALGVARTLIDQAVPARAGSGVS